MIRKLFSLPLLRKVKDEEKAPSCQGTWQIMATNSSYLCRQNVLQYNVTHFLLRSRFHLPIPEGGLGHVTCFHQWDISQWDIGAARVRALGLALPWYPWELCNYHV